MYTVYDSVANAFNNPIYAINDGTAIRLFTEGANDENSFISKNPESYALYHIGTWNEQDGTAYTNEVPRKIIQANQCISKKQISDNPPILEKIEALAKKIDEQTKEMKDRWEQVDSDYIADLETKNDYLIDILNGEQKEKFFQAFYDHYPKPAEELVQ